MEQRVLGRTGRAVSVVGLGTWQLGADWGNVSEADAMAVLRAAVESGVTTVIPGACSTGQARQNAEAAGLPPRRAARTAGGVRAAEP